MKIKLLITGILSLVTIAAFAQKKELDNADDKFKSYDLIKTNKLFAAKAESELADAKTSIDNTDIFINYLDRKLTNSAALKSIIIR